MQIDSATETLAPYVKNYWAMEHRVSLGGDYLYRIVPSGLSELMFYLGDLPGSIDPGKSITGRTLLSGQQKEYYDLQISGHLNLFSVVFQPHGLMVFFDLPLTELFNQNVPLRYILKDVVNELENRLYEAHSFNERKGIVESFLARRLTESKKKYDFERIRCCMEMIHRSGGAVGIETLASNACLSRKQFERVFRSHVGSSPGHFLKTVRFQNAIHGKSLAPELSLTELSYKAGYYDQAHMNNEFQRLAGMTPGQYFASCDPYSDYFS